MYFSKLMFSSVISAEQSHISDIPVWKSNRGSLQNQTGMISFFSSSIRQQFKRYHLCCKVYY